MPGITLRRTDKGDIEVSFDDGVTWSAPATASDLVYTSPVPFDYTRSQAPATPPDPFGDAVRSAQEVRPEPDPTYRPDDFTAPGFDADAAYRRAMGG